MDEGQSVPSASLAVTPGWEEQLIQRIVLPSRRMLTSRNGLDKIHMKFNRAKCRVLHLGMNKPPICSFLAVTLLGRKNFGIFVDTQLNLSWQCTIVEKADGILGWIKRNALRLREVILTLHLALVRPHLK